MPLKDMYFLLHSAAGPESVCYSITTVEPLMYIGHPRPSGPAVHFVHIEGSSCFRGIECMCYFQLVLCWEVCPLSELMSLSRFHRADPPL